MSVVAAACGAGFPEPCPPSVIAAMEGDSITLSSVPGETLVENDEPLRKPPRIRNARAATESLEREYPAHLRDMGIGGIAAVWVFVDPQGDVQKSSLARSSGRRELDTAALRVAESMRFTPATFDGCAVPVWVSFPITFYGG